MSETEPEQDREQQVTVHAIGFGDEQFNALFDRVAAAAHALDEEVFCSSAVPSAGRVVAPHVEPGREGRPSLDRLFDALYAALHGDRSVSALERESVAQLAESVAAELDRNAPVGREGIDTQPEDDGRCKGCGRWFACTCRSRLVPEGSLILPPNPLGTSATWQDYEWRAMAGELRRHLRGTSVASVVFELIADVVEVDHV